MTLRRSSGFTLVELAVVLLILSVVTAILLPSLPRLTGADKTAAVRRLAAKIESLREEAPLKKKRYS